MTSNKKGTIHFIITGGTIDAFYDGAKDTVSMFKNSVIPNYVKNLKLYENIQFTEICMKDSRNLTTVDRKKIIQTIEKSGKKKIIITHGTYTMPDTARYLKAHLKNGGGNKVIILTGSMIPMAEFTSSDGPFNLGYSIARVQNLSPGIYVCMNGKTFSPDEIIKIIYKGRFGSIFTK